MQVKGGHGSGRKNKERVGGKGTVLVYCTSPRQTDSSTALGNEATAAAKEKNPIENSSRYIHPHGGPQSPSPRALAETA